MGEVGCDFRIADKLLLSMKNIKYYLVSEEDMEKNIKGILDKREQLYQLFSLQKDNIIVTDQAGIITYINRNTEKLFDVMAKDVLNTSITKLVCDFSTSTVRNHCNRPVFTGINEVKLEVQSQHITVEQEQLEILLITEVTDNHRKNISDAKKIDFIDKIKNLQNGIFTMAKDENGQFVYTMSIGKLLEDIGAYDERLRNHTPFEVFPKDIAFIKHSHYEKAFQGERVNYEIDIKGKYVYVDVVPIKNGNEVTEIVGTVLDISELKSTQEELLLNQEQYESLVKLSQDFLVVFNKNARIVNMNPKALALFELSEQESTYENIEKILLHTCANSINGYLEEALAGNIQNFEIDFRDKNLNQIYLNVMILPVIIDNQIQGVYMIGKDISEQKKVQDMNAYLAHHDELTMLPNRRWMASKTREALQQINSKSDEMLAILLIDLDRFKSINDTLGHQIGDQLLSEMGKRILASINIEKHFACRMGGDEFLILCSGITAEEEVITIAEKFLEQLVNPFYIEEYELLITASIGISLYPTGGMDAIDLMKNADIALYKAKDLGRNMYQIYDPSMNKRSYQSFLMERDLRKAIMNDEFIVHLQPRVDAITQKTVSAEALIRWMHPELGLVSPGEFIPLAEETGLIIPMGKWMKRKVCEKLVEWREAGIPLVPISVNISSQRFLQKEFASEIRDLLREFQLEGKWLEIEITENSIMKNEETVFKTIRELKDLGVKIYIDDFGTGYSSFNYLKTFQLDGVKIDRSFIQNISSESENASITTAMIKMAQHLKLEVIAEGVETKEELEYLLEQNCHYIQGFYFGRPCATEEFEKRFLKGALVVK
ncbi:PAS domain S-box-containing protein/diguanylate cyclase (GGDEF)-like protein [Ureibacillus chungkukjangi]|uniref:PAS domain S-box-containing protein/diguanylate cyclase (GGDEF)-like protein n=2 Tax=Ureibacillus chungkukjangi TaxID=1202712 RepID=A0A318TPQ2_9BACL|nr:PAS domain S-box-containing protein/diguanylate cyclase (GGDEF)-like protein [Ureibacillus chungkukjangi]